MPRAGAAQRVAEGDGAALRVDLLLGDSELVGTPQALAGESLIDLEDVNVLLGDAGELEELGDVPQADTREQRLDADDRWRRRTCHAMGWPSFSAVERFMRSTAAAPSLTCEALPA